MASRYAQPMPAQVKKRPADLKHVSAPIKGLSLSSKLVTGDPLTALILDNFVIEENQISCRGGTLLRHTDVDGDPIESFVPYYGAPNKIAGATNGKLVLLDGTILQTGFTGNDWSWTAFSNLSSVDYTVMVNGSDGVWSWDGGSLPAGVIKETVTAPASATWVVPDQFNIVLAHMNRLWFADSANLAVYYLPLQQKTGEVKVLPLNAYFKRGGTIRAMYTWTTDGAVNLNDQLVIFTSNGECAIYSGVDPDSDWDLTGIFRFDAPMSKHSVANYGGDLYVLISTGLVPMSTAMRAEHEQLGQSDRNIFSEFLMPSFNWRNRPGWQVLLNPSSGRMICNTPAGGTNVYKQMVRFMPNTFWATWSNMPARCWGWMDNRLFFGSDYGEIFEMSPDFLNDNGEAIKVDVMPAWSAYGTPAQKQFKMVLPYLQTDGQPRPFVDFRVDYDMSPPTNQPDVTFAEGGATWDVATWDVDGWAAAVRSQNNWSGVAAKGRVGAPRMQALVFNCKFSLSGWDVLFEAGAAI